MKRHLRRTTVPSYLSGLRLSGRRVVVVGAGGVADRRLTLLLDSGAEVVVIAPAGTPRIARLAHSGQLSWEQREFRSGDLAGAWYVLAATDDPSVNLAVSAEAEQQQTFCVRADDASDASAWTPATAEVDGVTIGVLAGGNPRRAVHIRELLVDFLARIARRAA